MAETFCNLLETFAESIFWVSTFCWAPCRVKSEATTYFMLQLCIERGRGRGKRWTRKPARVMRYNLPFPSFPSAIIRLAEWWAALGESHFILTSCCCLSCLICGRRDWLMEHEQEVLPTKCRPPFCWLGHHAATVNASIFFLSSADKVIVMRTAGPATGWTNRVSNCGFCGFWHGGDLSL